jgi:succinate-semialdehyde dehydrogenase / glutarate-semialdehyde dehydrogenase
MPSAVISRRRPAIDKICFAPDREARTMTIRSINPATGQQLADYEEMTAGSVREAVGKAHRAFLAWRRTGFSSRAGLMRQAAQLLRDNSGLYADLMAREMGKPVRDGVAEIQKCALTCDFYADNAEPFLALEPVKTEARNSFVML